MEKTQKVQAARSGIGTGNGMGNRGGIRREDPNQDQEESNDPNTRGAG